jgi:8-oxo-dGTP diphosphatase
MATAPRFDEIDWAHWTAVDICTLVFVLDGPRILLIRKKRGLGAGKVNGPGGRLEPGESIEACAAREVHEEVGLIISDPVHCGILRFQFADGYSTHVHVYRTDRFEGTLVETDEADPFWVATDAIPYDEMWADDRYWIPLLLEGVGFDGRFLFDGDRLVDYVLDEAR